MAILRFVLVDHAYGEFLDWLYRDADTSLSRRAFGDQRQVYFNTLFATSDFYVQALRSLGHEAEQLVVNCDLMQRAWEREFAPSPLANIVDRLPSEPARRVLGRFGLSRLIQDKASRRFDTLLKQVRALSPDILYIQSIFAFDSDQLRVLKQHTRLLVGEHAAMRLPEDVDFRLYDMVISSFGPTVDWLRARGVRAELNRLAFDPRVDREIPAAGRDLPVSFSGSLFEVHRSRLELLETVAAVVPQLLIFGHMTLQIPQSSNLRGRINPAVWGREMYGILRRSVATLNHHGDVLPYANNMRLYEATGMGCLLVTDFKENLGEIFEPDVEVVTYRDAAECADKVRFYLDEKNQSVRERIMAAGRRRTLTEHTYEARMKRLVELVRAN
jgi:hypothetical protein